jgi:hypothetical protein
MTGVNSDDLAKKIRGDDKSMEELHKRVEELTQKQDKPQ